jgi:hypothetical protein
MSTSGAQAIRSDVAVPKALLISADPSCPSRRSANIAHGILLAEASSGLHSWGLDACTGTATTLPERTQCRW